MTAPIMPERFNSTSAPRVTFHNTTTTIQDPVAGENTIRADERQRIADLLRENLKTLVRSAKDKDALLLLIALMLELPSGGAS